MEYRYSRIALKNRSGSFFLRRAVSVVCFLLTAFSLCGQGLFDDTNDTTALTNATTMQKKLPLASILTFGFSVGSFQSEDSAFSGFDPDRDPSDAFRFLELGYTRFFSAGLGFRLSLIREEEAGWQAGALGIWRKESEGRLTGSSGIELRAGVRLVKSPANHDKPVVLFAWGVLWGDTMKHFISLDADGFFFVPWSPGFLLSDDSRFALRGQWRPGVLGLGGSLGLINRKQSATENIRIVEAVSELLFFRRQQWKLAFRFTLQQKALLTGSGSANVLQSYRNAYFIGAAVSGRYRDSAGRLYRYSWGVDFMGHQELFDSGYSDPVWESDTLEVSFFFRGSMAL